VEIVTSETEDTYSIDMSGLSNITVKENQDGFVVALIDDQGFETVRGFGANPAKAINDLHRNLI